VNIPLRNSSCDAVTLRSCLLGNPDIVREFNPKSFINLHDFKNDEEAIDHIIQVDQNPALLEQYLREPFFYNNEINEWFDIKRLRNFLVKAIESPRTRRTLLDIFHSNARHETADTTLLREIENFIKQNYLMAV